MLNLLSKETLAVYIKRFNYRLILYFGFLPKQKSNNMGKVHGVQHRMISVVIFFVFSRLLFFALLLLYVT